MGVMGAGEGIGSARPEVSNSKREKHLRDVPWIVSKSFDSKLFSLRVDIYSWASRVLGQWLPTGSDCVTQTADISSCQHGGRMLQAQGGLKAGML